MRVFEREQQLTIAQTQREVSEEFTSFGLEIELLVGAGDVSVWGFTALKDGRLVLSVCMKKKNNNYHLNRIFGIQVVFLFVVENVTYEKFVYP